MTFVWLVGRMLHRLSGIRSMETHCEHMQSYPIRAWARLPLGCQSSLHALSRGSCCASALHSIVCTRCLFLHLPLVQMTKHGPDTRCATRAKIAKHSSSSAAARLPGRPSAQRAWGSTRVQTVADSACLLPTGSHAALTTALKASGCPPMWLLTLLFHQLTCQSSLYQIITAACTYLGPHSDWQTCINDAAKPAHTCCSQGNAVSKLSMTRCPNWCCCSSSSERCGVMW